MPRLLAVCLVLVLAGTLWWPRPPAVIPPPTADVVWRAATHLEASYVRPGEVTREELVAGALEATAEHLGVDPGAMPDLLAAVVADPPAHVPDGYLDVWRAWEVGLDTVDDPEELRVQMLRRMVQVTGDPVADLLVGVDLADADHPDDAYHGIGVLTTRQPEGLLVVQPFPGSPAARAGLRPGDVIVAVDGISLAGSDDAHLRVRGVEGTAVDLRLARSGIGDVDVTVTREAFDLASTGSRRLGGGIGYLSVTRLGNRTADEVRSHLGLLHAQGIQGLVLDLRQAAGGSHTAALEVAGEFLDGILIYQEADLVGERIGRLASRDGSALDLPMIVLIDGGTSGASEIVAASLQEYRRAPLLGTPTGGHNRLYEARSIGDGMALVVLQGHWYTPAGNDVSDQGLVPDRTVPLFDEDRFGGFDRQLQTAFAALWQAVGIGRPEQTDPAPP